MHTHTPHTLFLYAQNKYFKSEVKERKRNAVYICALMLGTIQ